MPTFEYQRRLEMKPRPGLKYSTTYIKQRPQQYQRTRAWFHQTGETIVDICGVDPSLSEWFVTPMPDFRRSVKGEYYSPADLLTDILEQMALEKDLTQAMVDRWNRLTQGTPWQIHFASEVA
jgi:hypothetical protein